MAARVDFIAVDVSLFPVCVERSSAQIVFFAGANSKRDARLLEELQ
jgi:hypothetical protein